MARKFVGDPAPVGKGSGLKTFGESKSTKAAKATLAYAKLKGLI